MPRPRLWEYSTAWGDPDSPCVPPAHANTPPTLLWILRENRLCLPYASRKGGGGTSAAGFLHKRIFF